MFKKYKRVGIVFSFLGWRWERGNLYASGWALKVGNEIVNN